MLSPWPSFMFFGMGSRRKLVYVPGGRLLDALTLEPVRTLPCLRESLEPADYRVTVEAPDGSLTRVLEDEEGVWLEAGAERECLTRGVPVALPRFEASPHAALLRVLHGELLTQVSPFGPVPNLWVYPRPWYRDAVMVCLCLRETGNLHLVEPWVMGLRTVWDRNNAGEAEADNLGQLLFLVSLFGEADHPLVARTLAAVSRCERHGYITGLTDGAEHPVYQTKWLKLGLRSLGLDDPYRIPEVPDSYSALFWMDFRDQHVPGPRFGVQAAADYPYLSWAEAHFHGDAPPLHLLAPHAPLTWEAAASEAEYWRLKAPVAAGILPDAHLRRGLCTPHTWHAAEAFLYLLEPAGEGASPSMASSTSPRT